MVALLTNQNQRGYRESYGRDWIAIREGRLEKVMLRESASVGVVSISISIIALKVRMCVDK